jgi:hypothetical protein
MHTAEKTKEAEEKMIPPKQLEIHSSKSTTSGDDNL